MKARWPDVPVIMLTSFDHAAVSQGTKAFVRIADEPAVDRAPIDAIAGGDVGDLSAIEHLPDREITLLNHRKLRKHPEILLGDSVEPK